MENSVGEPAVDAVDIPVTLAEIPTPQTPEISRSQVTDDDSLKTESPKPLKPVLGKLQAKKRLMAFAKMYNTIPNPVPKVPKLKHKTHGKKYSEDGKNKSES